MALIPRRKPDFEHSAPAPAHATPGRRRWRDGRNAGLDPSEAVPPPRLHAAPASLDALLDELSERWGRGEMPRAEEYIARLSVCGPDDVVALAYQEYCLAESAGLDPDPEALLDRFPDHRDRLGRLLGLHAALDPGRLRLWAGDSTDAAAAPMLPEAGDELGPYRLLRELGRGAFARVFLAEQADLEDRLVVVKVSGRGSPEPRLLARARHAHIVEVIRRAEAEDEAGATLHLLVMPFLGGASLAAVLDERRRWGGGARTGAELLADLDHVAAPEYPEAGRGGPTRELLARLPHAKAVAWIVARLAEALDHAHVRGVTHGDLKPSNVLLTADGRPMLLDFNLSILAADWPAPEGLDGTPTELGGTLAYMAPERLCAVADPDSASVPRPGDRHRADIYALGLILAEALSGRVLEVPDARRLAPRDVAAALAAARGPGSRFLRLTLGTVPPELRPILQRCLAPDPADRYGRAAELAEDLDRYRHDRPPRFAGPLGRRQRLAGWCRRHRLAVAAGVLVIAGAVPAGVAGIQARRDARDEAALAKLESLWNGATPGVYRCRRDGQRIPIAEADPARPALDALARYGMTEPGDWRQRDDVRALPARDRLDLEAWLMEQAWRYAEAVAARPEWPSSWRRALALLEKAGGPAPPAALRSQMTRLRGLLDLPEPPPPAAAPAPQWQEEYLSGVEDEQRGRPAEALAHYRAALVGRPDAYWSHYRLSAAACAPDVRDFAAAEAHMRRCLAIRPTNPLLHLFLAGLLYYNGRPGEAFDACNRALELDPELQEGYRTRFWIRQELFNFQEEGIRIARRPDDADPVAVDYRKLEALFGGRDAASSWQLVQDAEAAFGRDVAFAGGPTGEAFARLRAAAFSDPDARRVVAQQLFFHLDHPEEAIAELDAVLERAPDDLAARLDRAQMLFATGRDAGPELEAVIDDPRFEALARQAPAAIGAYHMLTSLAIRAGEPDRALTYARRGLDLSDRLGGLRCDSHYALARALATAARSQPELIPAVAEHLNQAAQDNPEAVGTAFQNDGVFEGMRPAILPLLTIPGAAPSPTP